VATDVVDAVFSDKAIMLGSQSGLVQKLKYRSKLFSLVSISQGTFQNIFAKQKTTRSYEGQQKDARNKSIEFGRCHNLDNRMVDSRPPQVIHTEQNGNSIWRGMS
jgi:hypothetical protein